MFPAKSMVVSSAMANFSSSSVETVRTYCRVGDGVVGSCVGIGDVVGAGVVGSCVGFGEVGDIVGDGDDVLSNAVGRWKRLLLL